MTHTVEHTRMSGPNVEHWRRWGSYVSARSWGTVRESGTIEKAWGTFPFEHARSRAARWAEDGIGGFSDNQQRLCLTSAFWNGQDPLLKERFFGLTNDEGNHGEDIKDYFYFVDGVPSYSYMKMLYRYPQAEFPYQRLRQENAQLGLDQPAIQLVDVLPNTFACKRYFDIVIEFAKADTDDLLYRITATNCGDRPAPLHILPQLFYRNTWGKNTNRPQLRAVDGATVMIEHPDFTGYHWYLENSAELLFTDNETNLELLFDSVNEHPYTKDGIDYAIVRHQQDRVNPLKVGTKCAAHHHAVLEPQETWVVRARLSSNQNSTPFADFDAIFAQRQQEADAFYAELQRDVTDEEERALQRAVFAGLNWNNNFYHFNVKEWLQQSPESTDGGSEDNPLSDWQHFDAHDILAMPDPWEYPWLATWDLSFQLVTLGLMDVALAKQQALVLLSERYMHPNGAMAAFEGDLETPHPPVHAWTVWHLYHKSGQDEAFLQTAYAPLKAHFEWWLKTHQPEDHLFDGGFLGKDNISILDRNKDIPEGGYITQADSTGWMAFFTLNMLAMAIELGNDADVEYFLHHFVAIRVALQNLWDDQDQYFYDVVRLPNGKSIPLKVRSLVGLIPLAAALVIDASMLKARPALRTRLTQLANETPDFKPNAQGSILLSVVPQAQLTHLFNVLLDTEEFLAPYGLRSLSKVHSEQPVKVTLNDKTFELEYVPGYSVDEVFGGNSNWRGPIWAPLNHLLIETLHVYHDYFKADLIQQGTMRLSLEQAAYDIVRRLILIFKRNDSGYRPYLGDNPLFKTDPRWQEMVWFYEYFNPETGAGLGASHQNGWTAFIAGLIHNQGRGRLPMKRKST